HLVRKKMNDSVTSVFITTPSLKVLEERLNNRNSDSLEVIEKRVKNAKKEIEFFDEYDYFIVNDNLESASNELVSIANIARAKAKLFDKEKIVSNWLN
ncbi:guanylate kinase, partial [Aliarcobacter butzleri]